MQKALIIDDDYGRPTRGDLFDHAERLRAFITDNIAAKAWFDQEFGLSGDHTRGDYLDPLFDSPAKIAKFWEIRNKGPVGAKLPETVFPALVADITGRLVPLDALEGALRTLGWEVKKLSQLPEKLSIVEDDISLIAIDYILDDKDLSQVIQKSEEFLQKCLSEAARAPGFSCPFIVLISRLPKDAENDAERFRTSVGIDGSFFRFWAKRPDGALGDFEQWITTYLRQRPELESFRKMHESFKKVTTEALEKLKDNIRGLTLQDLATFHVGQLVSERETLSDYLAWLYGQVFVADVINNVEVAARCAKLPQTSYEVLLGHLRPTDNIPKTFSAFSLSKPGSAKKYQEDHGKHQIRFGDLFSFQRARAEPAATESGANRSEATAATQGYLLVISQTCDLIHCKITNGQVLCLEGKGEPVGPTEVDLLKATIKQLEETGNILIRDTTGFIQIGWETQNLRTVSISELALQRGYDYLGRLNEIYALEAQRNALEALARVGVPIQPTSGMYFRSVKLRVFSDSAEMTELAARFDPGSYIAVLRNEKAPSPKRRLLLSDILRTWLIGNLERIRGDATIVEKLKQPLLDLVNEIRAQPDWNLTVKDGEKGATFWWLTMVKNPKPGAPEVQSCTLPATIVFILRDVFRAIDRPNARVEIEFDKT